MVFLFAAESGSAPQDLGDPSRSFRRDSVAAHSHVGQRLTAPDALEDRQRRAVAEMALRAECELDEGGVARNRVTQQLELDVRLTLVVTKRVESASHH